MRLRNGGGPTVAAASQKAEGPFVHVHDHPPVIRNDPDHVADFVVIVTNPTDQAVRFADFHCDCGCTAGHLESHELAPHPANRPVRG